MTAAAAPAPARPPEAIGRAAGLLALVTTGLVGGVTLLLSSYRVTTCFRRPDGFGGCGTVLHPFSPEALPALLWPAALLAVLVLLAAVAWRARSFTLAGIATTGFAALAAGPILLVAPLLVVPVALLVLAVPLRAGRGLRPALVDLAIALILTALAVASAYTLLFAVTLWRGGWIGGIAPAMWLYLAFATAVAIGVGCALANRTGEPFPFARGALVAFVVCGTAGSLGLAATAGESDLKLLAFRSVIGVAAAALPIGFVALHRFLRFPFRHGLAGVLVATATFPLCIAITLGALSSFGPGPLAPATSIGPELPRVPWLPGTSTLP